MNTLPPEVNKNTSDWPPPAQRSNSGSVISLRRGRAPTVQMQSRWAPASCLWTKWEASGQIPSIKMGWNQGLLLVFQRSRRFAHMQPRVTWLTGVWRTNWTVKMLKQVFTMFTCVHFLVLFKRLNYPVSWSRSPGINSFSRSVSRENLRIKLICERIFQTDSRNESNESIQHTRVTWFVHEMLVFFYYYSFSSIINHNNKIKINV